MSATRSNTPVKPRPLLLRWWWLVAAAVLLTLATAVVLTAAETPEYTSSAGVLIEAPVRPNEVPRSPDMGTEKSIAESSVVLTPAAEALSLSQADVADGLAVAIRTDSDVMRINFSSADPLVAQAGAAAIADSYVAFRNTTLDSGLRARLVSHAYRPSGPSSPDWLINCLAAVFGGLLIGFVAAFVTDRCAVRVRSVSRWQEVAGVPVVLRLTRDAAGLHVAPSDVDAVRGRLLRRLPAQGGTVVVTGAHTDVPSETIATALAEALERTGTAAAIVSIIGTEAHWRRIGAGQLSAAVPAHSPVVHGIAAVRDAITRLRDGPDALVISAPATGRGLDGLDVADLADLAVIVDDLRDARAPAVSAMVAELRAAGCDVTGAVLIVGGRRHKHQNGSGVRAAVNGWSPMPIRAKEGAHDESTTV
jgi:capsular polysaccharide biosynthesis protein